MSKPCDDFKDMKETYFKSVEDIVSDSPIPNYEVPMGSISAESFLGSALGHMEDRGATYDTPGGERSMGKTVVAFNAITGHSIKESDGWLLLQLLKDTRQWSREGCHLDSAEDCIAYAALKGEALSRGD